MDCFADDRQAFREYEKFFNSSYLSDVTLVVEKQKYPAHRLILARGSDVFERMLSQRWEGEKNEITLSEEPQCVEHFETFLRFFYFNHAVLSDANVLPLLILADKYNFVGLRKVCIDYAISYVLNQAPLKSVLTVWFDYSSKASHSVLIEECVRIVASQVTDIVSCDELADEWLSLDRDQLVEFLKSNDLVVPNEYFVWSAVQKWIDSPEHPERRGSTASPTLNSVLPWIRFPYMSAEELSEVENSTLARTHSKLFVPLVHTGYKFVSLPLCARATKDFVNSQFLLRSYTDLRWDARIVVSNEQLYERGVTHEFHISTRSSTVPMQAWKWSLMFTVATAFRNPADELKLVLAGVDIDQARSVEFLVAVVGENRIMRQVGGKKQFTKSRYHTDLDLQSVVNVNELFAENSSLLVKGCLHLQLTLRPVM